MQPKAVGFALVVVTLMAGCDVAPNAAKILDPSGLRIGAEGTVNNTNEKDAPWPGFTETHPCTGDVITFTDGNSHFVEHWGFDNLGGFHMTSNVISRGHGVGTSGKQYTVFDQEKFSDQAPANPGGFIIMDKQEMRVSGPTKADDYVTVFQDRIVMDSQGNTTTTVVKDAAICK